MKRILHIYKSYFPDTMGGVEETINNLVNTTQGHCVDHTVLTLSNSFKKDTVDDVKIVRFPTTFAFSSCPCSLPLVSQFHSIVQDFDILHYHSPWPFGEALQLLLNIKKPYLVTYHSDIVRQKFLKKIYQPILKKFLGNAKRIAVTSQNYLDTSQDLQPHAGRCRVIPLGIPDLQNPSSGILQYWKNRVGENFLLFIGVLRYYKGLSVLLDALKGKNIPAVIAGEGPCRASLEAQASDNALTTLQFVGKISKEDKSALLKLSRGVVLPSNQRSEAFGISLLEGLAAGKPLISANIGTGTTFINQAYNTGWVVLPNSPSSLANAINELFANDEAVEKFSKNARNRYEQYFTSKKMGEQYVKLYDEVLR